VSGSRPLSRIVHLALVAALGAAALAAAPASQAAVPQDFSAADQYVESVPTSGGPRPAGVGGDRSVALPPGVRLSAGDPLARVATSRRLGAPDRKLRGGKRSSPAVPSATINAIDDGGGGVTLWLLLGLLAVTGAVAGTAVHRYLDNKRNAAT
jgi:hypothetical protein